MKKILFSLVLALFFLNIHSNAQSNSPDLNNLSEDGLTFISEQTILAKKFLAKYSNYHYETELELFYLDDAIENWKNASKDTREKPAVVIDQIGALFGEVLVEKLAFEWKLLTDDHGKNLSVVDQKYFVHNFPFLTAKEIVEKNKAKSFAQIQTILLLELKEAKRVGEMLGRG